MSDTSSAPVAPGETPVTPVVPSVPVAAPIEPIHPSGQFRVWAPFETVDDEGNDVAYEVGDVATLSGPIVLSLAMARVIDPIAVVENPPTPDVAPPDVAPPIPATDPPAVS